MEPRLAPLLAPLLGPNCNLYTLCSTAGADLANIVNEAALLTARQGLEVVGFQELLMGVQRTRFGVNGSTAAAGPAGKALQRLNKWLLDAAAGPKQPVKVSSA
jgi:hypothetical protein